VSLIDRTWLLITEIPNIPQSTLRRWCANGTVQARKRGGAAAQDGEVWEIYLPALRKLLLSKNDPPPDPLSEIEEAFAEVAQRPSKPFSRRIDNEGKRKK
jgi:hypothetical protein